ncbi:MAG: hypothetical protein U0575_02895 [Phycisphaerales bacterium]
MAPGASSARALRVPIGYIYTGIAAAVVVVVLAYVAGVNHGANKSTERRAAELAARLASEPDGAGGDQAGADGRGVKDPLRRTDAPRGAAGGSGRTGDLAGAAGAGSLPQRKPGEDGKAAPAGKDGRRDGTADPTGDSRADPRQPGWSYFVVARPMASRAGELVKFLRDNGLDACVVRDHNAESRKVIVLPGFSGKPDRTSAEYKDLRARLIEVGKKWERAGRGNKGFEGAYPEQFTG